MERERFQRLREAQDQSAGRTLRASVPILGSTVRVDPHPRRCARSSAAPGATATSGSAMTQPLNMEQVLAEELKLIQDRRVYLKFGRLSNDDPTEPAADGARKKALKMGLTGLAFSGGGIRSADIRTRDLAGTCPSQPAVPFRLSVHRLRRGVHRLLACSVGQARTKPGERGAAAQTPPMRAGDGGTGAAPAQAQDRGHAGAGPGRPPARRRLFRARPGRRGGARAHQPHPQLQQLPRTPARRGLRRHLGYFAIYVRNFVINMFTILPATIILVVLIRLVVSYFTRSPRHSDWLFQISFAGALLSLLVSVAYIVVVLNEVSRSRDTSANRDGRGSETTPPLRYTKKWLCVLVIFPLFCSATFFVWMFAIDPKAEAADVIKQPAYEGMVIKDLIHFFEILWNSGELHREAWPWIGATVAGAAMIGGFIGQSSSG